MEMTDTLSAPVTEDDWFAYHDIRRRVLFENRGRGSDYDPNHPDEFRSGHHPLLFRHADMPIGVIRIDVTDGVAIFRRVAIRDDMQRRGHGRRLLACAEQFAEAHGCSRVDSHVDAGAVEFYERCGFRRVQATPDHGGTVLMTKPLR